MMTSRGSLMISSQKSTLHVMIKRRISWKFNLSFTGGISCLFFYAPRFAGDKVIEDSLLSMYTIKYNAFGGLTCLVGKSRSNQLGQGYCRNISRSSWMATADTPNKGTDRGSMATMRVCRMSNVSQDMHRTSASSI